ncbi:uncharacterized protein V1510DRAFT_422172 [Dipodascopsis tothii]|uniref:uncharacterized protein n=1 Tax=Dipodascopsis tothii TaxID=44089 RepID=UPI0034CFFA13
MGFNSPLPMSLKSECKKGARILSSFVRPNQVLGMDMVIPPHILANAKGLAIITVLKAGFLFSGRAGSGIVVARLPDGTWSAPSAIITAGAGVGGQIGAELTDFVMILNTRAAVESFSQLGSITLGGNISIAAGPIGRSAEAGGSASLKSVAAVFSYSKTRGLFAGVSLEGSALIERRDANRKFYGTNVTAKQLLSGAIEPPTAADPLMRVLDSRIFRGNFQSVYDDDIYNDVPVFGDDDTDSLDTDTYGPSRSSSRRNRDRELDHAPSSRRGGYDDYDDDYAPSRSRSSRLGRGTQTSWKDDVYDRDSNERFQRQHFESTYSDKPSRPSAPKPNFGNSRSDSYGNGGSRGNGSGSGAGRSGTIGAGSAGSVAAAAAGSQAVALFTFDGEQDGDLGFRKGDIIQIVKKTNSQNDWWTGRKNGKEGIFPANYVDLL